MGEVRKLLCAREDSNDGACVSSNEHSESVPRKIFAVAKIYSRENPPPSAKIPPRGDF